MDRAAAFLRIALSFENAISMGLKSGAGLLKTSA
jgi:hypothetical protein